MAETLLVLGNGFDLACGLNSRFRDYLDSDFYKDYKEKANIVANFFAENGLIIINGGGINLAPVYQIFEKITFWDLYFSIPHIDGFSNVKLWYDFEQKIHNYLDAMKDWKEEFKTIKEIKKLDKERYEAVENNYFYLALHYYYVYRLKIKDEGQLWGTEAVDRIIFGELKSFELRFGTYIQLQQNSHGEYLDNAKELVKRLLDSKTNDAVKYINTFNYSDISSVTPGASVWHVNGNSECPIFGVDFKDAPVDDFRYKYTKTFRRLELNEQLHHKCTPGKTKYTKAIVFGHSLNEQDYNYFYALFNNLDLTQERVRKPAHKIEFTYSPHEGQTSEEARIRLISAALKVLQSYNEEILHEPNFRLMDILHFNGAVGFREVSTDF